ncbi:MAG: fructosamine kinase family protein [Acidimicrobiales bacterium]
MASSANWPQRVADALGPVERLRPLGGSVWRATVASGDVVVKQWPGASDEARGLRAIGAVPEGPDVPEVLHASGDVIVMNFIERGNRTSIAEERLGRALSALHDTNPRTWGGGSAWIGNCPVDVSTYEDGPSFYAARLVELARRCGLDDDVDGVAARIGDVAPFDDPPALLHGDLWWGNVLWGSEDRPWLVDPSHHGGHPEEDLAMLALFGPLPARLMDAYCERRSLVSGWRQRMELWQLYPLLVHSVLFGGGYVERARAVARRFGGR